ncbi:hypothetical protein H5410_019407 [Solanum commersonii]|uniref:Uncharacterized protein n=1 Tax=Solanum commersonii TaxID=4109 RepID=A0A9J5ZB29_SOLCO|nr:hypothetical protein H5410_019407 [Solanum commersonii]
MHIVEMRMMRWMHGHIKSDKINNEVIQDKVGVTYAVDKMRDVKLRGSGRLKKYWEEVIIQDMPQLHITEDMTLDRTV